MATKNILQISFKFTMCGDQELWFDFLELPEIINNLKLYQDAAVKDFPDCKVRIVQVMEE